MNKMQAVHSFWSSFGLKAYDENSVPPGTLLPYITYDVKDGNFGETVFVSACLWYRSSSWAEITDKEMQISDHITRGGRTILYDGGAFWIQKASPWAQRTNDPSDEAIRRIILNVAIEFFD